MYGKQVAEEIRASIKLKVEAYVQSGIRPRIVTVLVEGDAACAYYAKSKGKTAAKLGIEYEILHFGRDASTGTIIEKIQQLNHDSSVHGIMVELPLPAHIDTSRVTQAISPYKDVDGLTKINRFANMTGDKGLYPATPVAAVKLLNHFGYSVSGKHVALVGFGETVGQPLFHLLVRNNATVTVCHAGTKDVSLHTKAADIIFVAVGKAGLITPDMVHSQHVIIDAGINESEGNIVGDVDTEVADKVRALSPTPGGVGTVTTMQLFHNLTAAMDWQDEEGMLYQNAADLA
ncbi:bifunctional 5,10-methylenetetrahydrofolate dehydrogenase/5,10-methenyltetrahydrofolate cyclohydrolase [Alicyclobacillus sp. SO9]|nr:bifunctional 5,10-methylenetetrahydrofolate dehydrogenase/5,10-methenyltetrahydrofolate cyclohydrolase [Alicyclobacillus sp. SO9]